MHFLSSHHKVLTLLCTSTCAEQLKGEQILLTKPSGENGSSALDIEKNVAAGVSIEEGRRGGGETNLEAGPKRNGRQNIGCLNAALCHLEGKGIEYV